MYGIFTYMYHKNQLNVDKYTIHRSYGLVEIRNHILFFWGSTVLEEICFVFLNSKDKKRSTQPKKAVLQHVGIGIAMIVTFPG